MENKQTEPAKCLPDLMLEYYESIQILSEKTKEIILNVDCRKSVLSRFVTDDKGFCSADLGIVERESGAMKAAILQDRPVDAESYRKFHVAYERFMGRNKVKQLDRPETFLSLFAPTLQTTDELNGNDASPSTARPSKTLLGMMSRLDCPCRCNGNELRKQFATGTKGDAAADKKLAIADLYGRVYLSDGPGLEIAQPKNTGVVGQPA